MIPVIDWKDSQLQDKIREAYTTVGFAVFTNLTMTYQNRILSRWYDIFRKFFDLNLETKMKYPYEGDTNLGYTMWLKENVDPSAPKDMKESFNYNNTHEQYSSDQSTLYPCNGRSSYTGSTMDGILQTRNEGCLQRGLIPQEASRTRFTTRPASVAVTAASTRSPTSPTS